VATKKRSTEKDTRSPKGQEEEPRPGAKPQPNKQQSDLVESPNGEPPPNYQHPPLGSQHKPGYFEQTGFTTSAQADYEHLINRRNTKMRRCQWLELRADTQGITTDPSIYMEIEDIQAEVEKLDRKLASLEDELVLSEEQQKAVVELLAAMGCTDANRIVLIKVTKGSVVLEMEMPLAGAARLLALHAIRHPQLVRKGISDIALAKDIDTQEKRQLDRAVKFEINDLQSKRPSDTSPYANLPNTIPLRVTIAESKLGEWYHLS
jgi:hypothetical protein